MRVRAAVAPDQSGILDGLGMNGYSNGVAYATPTMQTRVVNRAQIEVDTAVSTRAVEAGNGNAVDFETVKKYAVLLAEGVKMPPVEVWAVGVRLLLVDGFHRVEAHDLVHNSEPYDLEVLYRTGTMNEALLRATDANTEHGRPLSKKDRDKAMERYLSLSPLSYREIGGRLGVHGSTVMRFDQANGIRVEKVEPAAPKAAAPATTTTSAFVPSFPAAGKGGASAHYDKDSSEGTDQEVDQGDEDDGDLEAAQYGEWDEAEAEEEAAFRINSAGELVSAGLKLAEVSVEVDPSAIQLARAIFGEIDLAVVAPGVTVEGVRRVYKGADGYTEPWSGRVLVVPAGDYLSWHRKIVTEIGSETTGALLVVPAMPWEGWFVKLTKDVRKVVFLKDEPLAAFVFGEYDGKEYAQVGAAEGTIWTRIS